MPSAIVHLLDVEPRTACVTVVAGQHEVTHAFIRLRAEDFPETQARIDERLTSNPVRRLDLGVNVPSSPGVP
jgi:hypothetical protein